jgi:hypothetical protein
VVQKRVVEYDLALWGDLDQSTAMYTGDPTEQLVDKLRLENSDVEARIILSRRWIPVPVVSRIEEDYAALARYNVEKICGLIDAKLHWYVKFVREMHFLSPLCVARRAAFLL